MAEAKEVRDDMNVANGDRSWHIGQPPLLVPCRRALTKIKVVGVGDGGCTCVALTSEYDLPGVQYALVNTRVDLQRGFVNVPEVVQIGQRVASGFGAARYSRVTELTIEDSDAQLRSVLEDAELVLVTTGLGGATGTRAAPYVAALAREMGAFVLGVVTTPFSFEGSRRIGEAVAGLAQLRSCVDNVIVIHSDRLLRFINRDAEIADAFDKANEVVSQGLLSISGLLNEPGELGADFEDVRTVLGYPGGMLMAVGRGRGQSGLVEAAQEAIAYPLLNLSMAGARGIILFIKGGQDLTPAAVDAASAFISKACKHNPRTLFGMSIDRGLGDRVQLTLIATGL